MRVITDPKTGRMSTEHHQPPVSQEQLKQMRKEVRDIIEGKVQFHVDPFAAPPPVIEINLDNLESYNDWYLDQPMLPWKLWTGTI